MTFGPETYKKHSHYEENIGQEVIVSFNGTTTYGFLESVNDGLIKLNACLVSQPSGYEGDFGQKYMNRPAVFPAQASVLLPVDKGSIDSILENQERELKKAKEGDENGC